VADWDSVSYTSSTPHCLRRVDTDLHYPEDLNGRVHHDGQIWSRALWDIRSALGHVVADTLILEAQFSFAPDTSMPAAAQATVDAAQNLYGTAEATGMIFLILLGADVLNVFLALTQMPGELAQWVGQSGYSPLAVMFAIIAIYVVLGCLMDSLSMILLTIPIFLPIVMGLDYWGLNPTDKAIWFGIIALMVVEIGLITPPVGMNVYIINSLARDVPMAETFKGVVPFLISDAIRIALLVFFPILSLWLVRLLT